MPPDLLRRLFVTVSGILCVVGTLFGVGLFGGTEVNQSSSGNLAADATLIAPAGTAFSIWSVIYIGLFAYVIWQWLPKQATSAKARATGWLAALSMLLNAGWLLVTQFGLIWVSVGVIVALLVVCIMLVSRIAANPAENWGERLAVDASFGLYLGWVSVATLANLGAAIVSTGVAAESTLGEVSTVAALVAVLGLATFYVWRWKNLAVSAAIIWGVAWVGFGRLSDAPESTLVGVVALAVAVLIAVTGLLAKSIDWRSADPSKGVGTTRRADAIA
ncbi:TspO/MBR family protein [Pseudoclavibacter helvolus]|uniref:TspO/MBR family protein n=1 Tax=Pseudoclavibacter helvolus TaxID=255205 RepID=UPI0009EEF14A|nr:TspO/MBR family protein [Pseudoclavibacter helvolus]